MENFVHLHLHTHFSNAVTIPECINKPPQFIERIVKDGGKAICFTEHGNILSWVAKKKASNQAGLKYIHGIEFYLTETYEDKIKDNYHIVLLAKNYDGVKEINRLVSQSFSNRWIPEDNHFYYYPRIDLDSLINTSENIIVLTGCLGGPLWRSFRENNTELSEKIVKFIKNNTDRVWLEVQPHSNVEQIAYNKLLKKISLATGARLVGTNDVHSLTMEDERIRKILMKSKGVEYSEEQNKGFECWYKNRQQMEESFIAQGVFTEEEIKSLLDETVFIADLIEDFDFDYSFKYPKIFDDNTVRFKKLIAEGYSKRGLDKLPQEEQLVYRQRMVQEMKVFYYSDTIDYMLLIDYVIRSANEQNIFTGPGRGSVTGSLVSYLLGTTDCDPIKENLSFERFMNPDRVSLADIDTDVSGVGEYSDRDWITDFLINNENFNSTAIVTYNTLGLKSAIKDVGRALGYSPQEMNTLTKQIEDEIPYHIEEKYPKLCKLAKSLTGVITSIGRHAAGFVVTTRDVGSELGMISVSKADCMVSSISMKEIDMLNYVKLDILGLDNVALINKTCELAGIERATPNSSFIDFNDKAVMQDLTESTIGIFQFEGQRAQKLVKEMFSEQSQESIRKSGINTDPVSQLALLSAAMRPGAASIIDDVVQGKVFDNGHKALNELLADTLGYLIYQESQIEFLVQMCGRTKAQSDLIRRSIGKKDVETLNVEVPKIKQEFIKTMVETHGDKLEHAEEIADRFMRIFQDAANYSFSKNHAIPYSYIGYISAWLRYYYPLEFLTCAFQIFGDDSDKVKRLTEYAKSKGIKIKQPEFGFAKGQYFFDKSTNTIYEGVGPIKGMNNQIGDMLYELEEKDFTTFTDFLMYLRDDFAIYPTVDHKVYENRLVSWRDFRDLSEKEVKEIDKEIKALSKEIDFENLLETHNRKIDKAKLLSLVRLNYFKKFGGNTKLELILEKFNKDYKPNLKTMSSKWKKYHDCLEYEYHLEDEQAGAFKQMSFELAYLGRCVLKRDLKSKDGLNLFVTKILNIGRTYTRIECHSPDMGETRDYKISASEWRNVELGEGDLIKANQINTRPKKYKHGDEWVDHETEVDYWIKSYKRIQFREKVI